MTTDKPSFFYQNHTKRFLWRFLIGVSAASVLLEFFIHKRYSHFAESGFYSIDGMFAFYALTGFISCVILLQVARFLARYFTVKESYYD